VIDIFKLDVLMAQFSVIGLMIDFVSFWRVESLEVWRLPLEWSIIICE